MSTSPTCPHLTATQTPPEQGTWPHTTGLGRQVGHQTHTSETAPTRTKAEPLQITTHTTLSSLLAEEWRQQSMITACPLRLDKLEPLTTSTSPTNTQDPVAQQAT
jgi:hypothetical protein